MATKKLYVAKEGAFKTDWQIKESKAFTTQKLLHAHMKQKHGYDFEKYVDPYNKTAKRYVDHDNYYGYDIIALEIVDGKQNKK